MQTKIKKKYTNVVSLTWILTFNSYSKSNIHMKKKVKIMHFRTMQMQRFQKQYFEHESQSLNFQVIVHRQLPIYF